MGPDEDDLREKGCAQPVDLVLELDESDVGPLAALLRWLLVQGVGRLKRVRPVLELADLPSQAVNSVLELLAADLGDLLVKRHILELGRELFQLLLE